MNEYASLGNTDAGLTDSQREALLVAFETGYFEEPRNATLSDVAADLDISQPAASGSSDAASSDSSYRHCVMTAKRQID